MRLILASLLACLVSGSANGHADECEPLLFAKLPWQSRALHHLRRVGDFTIGAEKFRASSVTLEPGKLTPIDRLAMLAATERGRGELEYFEIFLADGTPIFRSEYLVSGEGLARGFNVAQKILAALKARSLEKTPLVIRDTRTHEIDLGAGRFTSHDFKATFLRHALLEMFGLRAFRYESVILYRKVFFLNSLGKRVLAIPENSLSYARGDYSLGAELDREFRYLSTAELDSLSLRPSASLAD